MILIDLSHTAHTRARSGIQKVARKLQSELSQGGRGEPVTWDPYRGAWRRLQSWERRLLGATGQPGQKRGARWPLSAKIRGWTGRLSPSRPNLLEAAGAKALILPELFSPEVERALPLLRQHMKGPAVGIFHDALALQLPELSPGGTVARMPAYLKALAALDGVAAVSEFSRQSLLGWWRWLGLNRPPPVVAIPLGTDPAPLGRPQSGQDQNEVPEVLCVCTIEGRKNHTALLEACEQVWGEGLKFRLRLIGHAQAETAGPVLARIAQLQSLGRALRYEGPQSDDTVEEAYARCCFTAYPSLGEGFGLPVIESLARGKPCLCAEYGALGESARDGGCLTVKEATSGALAEGLRRLLTEEGLCERLAREAKERPRRTWGDWAKELETWTLGLPKRG